MRDISNELVIKAAAGEISAFEDIYRAASGFVYNIALRVTNNRSDADEVTQDVFLSAYNKIGSFEFRSSFKTWIYRIAVNTAINHCKRRIRREKLITAYDPAIHDAAAPDKSDETLRRQEIEKTVVSALEKLDPDQRACVVLREIEGLDYRSIADALSVNINTVRSRLKRARERLLTLRGKE